MMAPCTHPGMTFFRYYRRKTASLKFLELRNFKSCVRAEVTWKMLESRMIIKIKGKNLRGFLESYKKKESGNQDLLK